MRVLVTGADGFVGSRLVARLRARGDAVLAADRAALDVRDAARVRARVAEARPDAIVHLAAVSFVPAAEAEATATFRVNYLGTRNVLEAVRSGAPGARVLLVSSSTIYGGAPPGAAPFDEAAPLRPANAYSRSKAAADLLGAAYAERGLDVLRVRPWNHTGAGRPDVFAESSFARQIAEIENGRRAPRIETGTLDSVRDFLHVDDVIDAYLALLEPGVPAGAYNVATGRGLSIRALLEALLAHASVRPAIVSVAARARAPDTSVGSAAKLRARTGWQPRREVEGALAELLAYWRQEIHRAGSGLATQA